MKRLKLILKQIAATIIAVPLLLLLMLAINQQTAGDSRPFLQWPEPQLDNINIYGEQAHFSLFEGFGQTVQLAGSGFRTNIAPMVYINRGLHLGLLPAGNFQLYAADLPISAPQDFWLEGYTITRGGLNNHYLFYSYNGRLRLSIRVVDELPPGVYDIIIDPGHGGNEWGASAFGRIEKYENMKASLYMKELFERHGLRVALVRHGDYSPGQPDAPGNAINPYIVGGRMDLIYSSQANYLISNHLNASPRGALRGWQLYSSVRADKAWQRAIGAEFDALGHIANDSFHSFGRHGIFKRFSQDNPATNTDFYFILRESGGNLTGVRRFNEAFPDRDLRHGVEAILVEYVFIDNRADLAYWDANWQALVEAVVRGSLEYWQVD